jgi:threonine dehydrogenase-like Zn-dependent dehydrogenase
MIRHPHHRGCEGNLAHAAVAPGYSPLEFRDSLQMLADGSVDAAPLVRGAVGLPGVEAAFDALAEPDKHAKLLIDPTSSVPAISA